MFFLVATSALAAEYAVDPAHTVVGFGITHMMVTEVHGTFGAVEGTVSYDSANTAATKVNAKIGLASVDTNQDQRDEHLRSPEFFDAAAFPEMTFVSTSATAAKKGKFTVTGDLTIKGVTKPVTLTVNTLSAEVKDPYGNIKVGTRATGTIKRSDFGLTWNQALEAGGWLVGDEVAIELGIELAKQG